MKPIITILFYLIIPFVAKGQFEKPNIPYQKIAFAGDPLPQLWYEPDSVRKWDESEYFNEFTRMFLPLKIVMDDSFVYCVHSTLGHFDNENFKGNIFDGIYISKRNIHTGQLIWHTFSGHEEAGRQEIPTNVRINKQGNLEIIGLRRFLPPENNNILSGIFGVSELNLRFFYREYNSLNGQLNQHTFTNLNDQNAPVLKEHSPNLRTKLFFVPEDSLFRYFQVLFLNDAPATGYITFLLNKNGQRVGEIDTIRTVNGQGRCNVSQLSTNGFVFAELNPLNNYLQLHFYSPTMDFEKSSEKIEIPYLYNTLLNFENKQGNLVFTTYYDDVNPPFFDGINRFILDHNGNMLDSFTLRGGNQDAFTFADNGDYYGVQKVEDSDDISSLVFRYKKMGEPIVDVKRFQMSGDYQLNPNLLAYYDDKIFVRNFEFHKDVSAYRAYSTLTFHAKDLGFPVSVSDFSVENIPWNIYPNPVSDEVVLKFGGPTSGRLMISDITGNMIYQQNITQKENESVSTEEWNSGVYFIHFVSETGRYETKKIVKI